MMMIVFHRMSFCFTLLTAEQSERTRKAHRQNVQCMVAKMKMKTRIFCV